MAKFQSSKQATKIVRDSLDLKDENEKLLKENAQIEKHLIQKQEDKVKLNNSLRDMRNKFRKFRLAMQKVAREIDPSCYEGDSEFLAYEEEQAKENQSPKRKSTRLSGTSKHQASEQIADTFTETKNLVEADKKFQKITNWVNVTVNHSNENKKLKHRNTELKKKMEQADTTLSRQYGDKLKDYSWQLLVRSHKLRFIIQEVSRLADDDDYSGSSDFEDDVLNYGMYYTFKRGILTTDESDNSDDECEDEDEDE